MPMKATYLTVDGEVISESRNGVRKDYVPDPLGSTVALLDSSQNQTDTFTYWPYGEERTRTGTTPTPFTYVGTLGYYRDKSNRSYVRARELEHELGRWMQVDPLWPMEPPFGYGRNAPVANSDPLGLRACSSNPCSELTGTKGACIAGLCQAQTTLNMVLWIKGVLGKLDPDDWKEILDLIRRLGKPPRSSPEDCCKAAGNFKGKPSDARSLAHIINLLCRSSEVTKYLPEVCAKEYRKDAWECEECCKRTFPGEGDPGNYRTRCEKICQRIPPF